MGMFMATLIKPEERNLTVTTILLYMRAGLGANVMVANECVIAV